MGDVLAQLIDRFGKDSVLTGADLAGRRASYLENQPLVAKALLLPESTEDVSEMLRLCCAVRQPVVPHGGLSNLVSSTHTTADEIALSLERMNHIVEIDPVGGTMTVQTGAVLQDVQKAAEDAGLFFPLDLPARESAVIGGLIGTNAGGLRVVRYGMMRDMVLGLETVLADGTVLDMMNKMLKKNAGYELKQLIIGSEGTLGVATRAVLRLWPPQPAAATALLAVDRFVQVTDLLMLAKRCIGGQLTSFEVMWNAFYNLTTTPPSPTAPPIRSDSPYYVLVESMGVDAGEEQARLQTLLDQAKRSKLFTEAASANTPVGRKDLWRVREDTQQIEAQYGPNFGFDVSLPILHMETYINAIERDLSRAFGTALLWVFGHLADGNLHIHIWGDSIDQERDHARVQSIVYNPLQSLGGSISAEHGIGLLKKPYLYLSRTPEELVIMRQIKAVLDPAGILNPGKIFD
jgi:FAD/FMN-containing dehydrogenase